MGIQDKVGLEGPEFEVDIERGKIREFARAMSAPLPEFIEGQNPVIPAMFLVSAPYTWGYTLERPRGTCFGEVGHDPAVSLHAEEAFRFHGPLLRAGDRLIAKAIFESAKEKQGASGGAMTFFTTLIEYRDLEGNLRAEQRTTSVVTSEAPGSGDWQYDLPPYRAEYPTLEPEDRFASIKRVSFAQLHDGASAGQIHAGALTLQDIVRFQGVVGEDDPLHHDLDWAKQKNYPQVFALGTHQASLMASYAAHWFDPCTVRAFKVRFRDVGWPGDRLVYNGKITAFDEVARTVSVHLTCARENGQVLNEAWMECDFNLL